MNVCKCRLICPASVVSDQSQFRNIKGELSLSEGEMPRLVSKRRSAVHCPSLVAFASCLGFFFSVSFALSIMNVHIALRGHISGFCLEINTGSDLSMSLNFDFFLRLWGQVLELLFELAFSRIPACPFFLLSLSCPVVLALFTQTGNRATPF